MDTKEVKWLSRLITLGATIEFYDSKQNVRVSFKTWFDSMIPRLLAHREIMTLLKTVPSRNSIRIALGHSWRLPWYLIIVLPDLVHRFTLSGPTNAELPCHKVTFIQNPP